MSKVKPGLGRGLDALLNHNINDAPDVVNYSDLKQDDGKQVEVLTKIPIDLIVPNPYQPRISFDPESLDELKKSILSNGLIQPITVRRKSEKQYELISGERRLRACKDIGYREIPAYIIKIDSDEALLAMALIENIQREKLNPIEIGQAYKRLMDECNLTQEEIAEKVGKDRTTIANFIRLLKLPREIQYSLIKEEITQGHARALINLPSEQLQLILLRKIKEKNLSVRKVEKLVKDSLETKKTEDKTTAVPEVYSIPVSTQLSDIEDKLRRTFGTKVICKQKNDGSGEIVIEFYSNEEFERLFELFDIINKTYH
jgi:ParB family transcriptional regulator, chromosome partitioning protein